MRHINLKKPGADVTTSYTISLQMGLILSLLAMITLFRIDFQTQLKEIEFNQRDEVISIEEIIQTEQFNRPPPPPRPPVPVEVPNDMIVEEIELNLDASLDLSVALELPPAPPAPPAAKKVEVKEPEEPEVFIAVEEMPELIGGLESVQKLIVYPEIAKKAGIEGRVFVQFVIDEKGNVTNPVVLKGIGGGCDEAALEAVKKAKFTPGKQRGRPVKVQYSIPIVFRLTAGDRKN
jgi:periplasmic protein TonB